MNQAREAAREHLKIAETHLPWPLAAGSIEGLRRYAQFLTGGELDLALTELEGVGKANPCPEAFWNALREAGDRIRNGNR